jgi:hypothetical protein
MSMTIPLEKTTNTFTFTLLLDDVFSSTESSLHDAPSSSSQMSEDEWFCAKDMNDDILTNVISPNLSVLASPVKNLSSKKKHHLKYKNNQLSEIPQIKNKKQTKSFLSNCFVDSDNEKGKCKKNSFLVSSLSPEPIINTPQKRQSLFSHEGKLENLILDKNQKKLKINKKKISGDILKRSLKGKHFDRIIKKLNRFVEICKVRPSA